MEVTVFEGGGFGSEIVLKELTRPLVTVVGKTRKE